MQNGIIKKEQRVMDTIYKMRIYVNTMDISLFSIKIKLIQSIAIRASLS